MVAPGSGIGEALRGLRLASQDRKHEVGHDIPDYCIAHVVALASHNTIAHVFDPLVPASSTGVVEAMRLKRVARPAARQRTSILVAEVAVLALGEPPP